MLHCLACDKQVPPWAEYCEHCLEEISLVYINDRSWTNYLKGVHPDKIPHDFAVTRYNFMFDAWEAETDEC